MADSSTESSSSLDTNLPRTKRRNYYCPHCSCSLAKATFYRHKSLYYDKNSNIWHVEKKAQPQYADTDSSTSSESSNESDTRAETDGHDVQCKYSCN